MRMYLLIDAPKSSSDDVKVRPLVHIRVPAPSDQLTQLTAMTKPQSQPSMCMSTTTPTETV